MFLRKLHILYFKNIEELELLFSGKIIGLIGSNGVGKTNVLDAIYYTAMTKSYFSQDVQNIQHQKNFFVIHAQYEHQDETFEVSCSVKKGEKKVMQWNQKPYLKITEHIGKIPIVFIAPQDQNIITEYADRRRKFLDALISKFDKEYLMALIQYHQVLQNRNAIIKQGDYALQHKDLIDTYNYQLCQSGEILLKKRILFFNEVKQIIHDIYQQLQDDHETLTLQYISSVQNDFLKELEQSLTKDIRMGYTSIGPHRDDFDILLNNYSAKNFASQGQQKSIIFALKWMELTYLHQKTQLHPLVLIDDIYDKLDDIRMHKLKQLIQQHIAGQIFITDNHPDRLSHLFENDSIQIISIEKNIK